MKRAMLLGIVLMGLAALSVAAMERKYMFKDPDPPEKTPYGHQSKVLKPEVVNAPVRHPYTHRRTYQRVIAMDSE